jgi:hypothetical protein
MLVLKQPLCELSMPPKVFCGQRERYSTATAIAFITEKLFITAAFNSKNIYLIEIQDDNTFKTLDIVKANHHPDIADYKDGMLALSGYPHGESSGWVQIYDIIDNKIVHRKDIELPHTKAHGVEIIDEYGLIITSNGDNNRGIMFLNIDEGKLLQNFNNFDYYPKDVVIRDNRLLVVTSQSLPEVGKSVIIKESILYLFNLNTLEKLDEVRFQGQTDSLTLLGENGFITLQGDDTLLHFTLIQDKLSIIKRIPGFSFPHGIDSFGDTISITNYGDNSLRFFQLEELIS